MTAVALTGAHGFLGWHLRSALLGHGVASRPIAVGEAFVEADASAAIDGSSRLVHVAGVNRGTDEEVREGNLLFARQLAAALQTAVTPPEVVVFANSVQATDDSVYGVAKAGAADIVRRAAESVGARFEDRLLPNLFGEHGAPFYNSVVATFSQLLATGGEPNIVADRELALLHAQDAADLLIGCVRAGGGESQASFSTTAPGISRGDHFHRRKVERFAVVEGDAVISMRRLFTAEVLRFEVSGEHPVAIDMPTMWSHRIENSGDRTLVTSFWANELFRPEHPDTTPEAV
jgi:nucleoside-diphosphate-sugar epimerase